MQPTKIQPQMLTVWRIRLALIAAALAFLSIYFYFPANWFWWVCLVAWSITAILFYIWYYPVKYRKLAYCSNQRCFIIHCGVIYTRIKAIPFANIQYTSLASTPLQRMFGICSLLIFSAGSTAWLSGLKIEEAIALQEQLSPPSPAGGDVIA